jgi:hypothetical protein
LIAKKNINIFCKKADILEGIGKGSLVKLVLDLAHFLLFLIFRSLAMHGAVDLQTSTSREKLPYLIKKQAAKLLLLQDLRFVSQPHVALVVNLNEWIRFEAKGVSFELSSLGPLKKTLLHAENGQVTRVTICNTWAFTEFFLLMVV